MINLNNFEKSQIKCPSCHFIFLVFTRKDEEYEGRTIHCHYCGKQFNFIGNMELTKVEK